MFITKRINLISFFLIIAFFVLVVIFSSQVSAWGASGGVDDDMDCLDDNPNTPDNPDGSCDECGNGGDYTYSSGSRSCCSTYPCYSAPNVCGWINEGTYTVCSSCGGSSSGGGDHDPANTIEDRSYNFGGPDGTGHESHGNW